MAKEMPKLTDREVEIVRMALEFLVDDLDQFHEELMHGAYTSEILARRPPTREEILELMAVLKD